MSAITGSDYLQIAEYYSSARNKLLSSVDEFYGIVGDVLACDAVQPVEDLLPSSWTFYKTQQDYLSDLNLFVPAVQVLNQEVLLESGLSTVSAWIEANVPGGVVPYQWSLMSAAAGFPINEDLVQSSSSS